MCQQASFLFRFLFWLNWMCSYHLTLHTSWISDLTFGSFARIHQIKSNFIYIATHKQCHQGLYMDLQICTDNQVEPSRKTRKNSVRKSILPSFIEMWFSGWLKLPICPFDKAATGVVYLRQQQKVSKLSVIEGDRQMIHPIACLEFF